MIIISEEKKTEGQVNLGRRQAAITLGAATTLGAVTTLGAAIRPSQKISSLVSIM